jgi:GNAT superfamily N-acetyltransferase
VLLPGDGVVQQDIDVAVALGARPHHEAAEFGHHVGVDLAVDIGVHDLAPGSPVLAAAALFHQVRAHVHVGDGGLVLDERHRGLGLGGPGKRFLEVGAVRVAAVVVVRVGEHRDDQVGVVLDGAGRKDGVQKLPRHLG